MNRNALETVKCVRCEAQIPNGKLQCPICKLWNFGNVSSGTEHDETTTLDKVKPAGKDRMKTGPWDDLWGSTKIDNQLLYGIVRTSVTLIAGSPGAGKSTLMLQMCDQMAEREADGEALYIATEEADEEIKERADRLIVRNQSRIRMVPAMSGAVKDMNALLENRKPKLILLDSLAGLAGEDDAMQIQVCKVLKDYAVRLRAPVIVITHVTKDDAIAGVMTLQHAVDTVMTFFPDEDGIRTLEVQKNRNGRAFISREFEMTEKGLILHVSDEDDDEE